MEPVQSEKTITRKDLSKRARYYQSVIDMDNLSRGKSFARGTSTRDDNAMYWATAGACHADCGNNSCGKHSSGKYSKESGSRIAVRK